MNSDQYETYEEVKTHIYKYLESQDALNEDAMDVSAVSKGKGKNNA